MINKITTEPNIDKNIRVSSNYTILASSARPKGIALVKPTAQDKFEKQIINFQGSIDKKPSSTNPINPIQIASLAKREELKKVVIKNLENRIFIEGSLVNFYKEGILTKQDILEIATAQAGRIPHLDREFLIKNKIPLTSADNEEVLNKRLYDLITPQLDIGSPSYIKQKAKIIKIGERDMENIPKNKKMIVILTGLPASGKSSLVSKKMQKNITLPIRMNI